MMNTLHVIQHVPFEGLGRIADWAIANGLRIKLCKAWEESLPATSPDDLIAVMGGPMNIDEVEKHPWLVDGRDWLRDQISAGRRILGVCLGAQLLANALGARVHQNAVKEIGWMPVDWTDDALMLLPDLPARHQVLHWHGDTFELPEGAAHLATSRHCHNQAFRHGRVLALQFHLEAGEAECADFIEKCGTEIENRSETVHSADGIMAGAKAHAAQAGEVMRMILDHWSRW